MKHQFAIYIVIGAICAIIDVGVMQLMILSKIYHVTAASVGFVTGLIVNFSLHMRITFSVRYSHSVLAKYIVVVALNYLLTILFVSISFHAMGTALVGKVISLPLIALNGFLLSRYWIFR